MELKRDTNRSFKVNLLDMNVKSDVQSFFDFSISPIHCGKVSTRNLIAYPPLRLYLIRSYLRVQHRQDDCCHSQQPSQLLAIPAAVPMRIQSFSALLQPDLSPPREKMHPMVGSFVETVISQLAP